MKSLSIPSILALLLTFFISATSNHTFAQKNLSRESRNPDNWESIHQNHTAGAITKSKSSDFRTTSKDSMNTSIFSILDIPILMDLRTLAVLESRTRSFTKEQNFHTLWITKMVPKVKQHQASQQITGFKVSGFQLNMKLLKTLILHTQIMF